MSTYAWVDLLSVLFPLLFSFSPRLRFHHQWRATAVGILAMMAFFIPWDILFAAEGVWRFSVEHTWSARLFGLPLEEWGFFICIPYACLFTYHCVSIQLKSDPLAKHARWISISVVVPLLTIALSDLHLKYKIGKTLLGLEGRKPEEWLDLPVSFYREANIRMPSSSVIAMRISGDSCWNEGALCSSRAISGMAMRKAVR